MTKLLLCFITNCFFLIAIAQTINVHSISERQTAGDNGYTLDGEYMIQSSRTKLLNLNYFGPTGVYPKTVSITDGYDTTGSLVNVSTLSPYSVFFFGSFDTSNPSTIPFSNQELDTLYNWSLKGGKVIIAGNPEFLCFSSLCSLWGFSQSGSSSSFISIFPTAIGMNSDLFNGPFGFVSGVSQGGFSYGYFTQMPSNSVVFGDDMELNPNVFMDCKTLDLIVSDIDVYTELGGVTSGPNSTSDNDRFWLNSIAFMDKLQQPPSLNESMGTLTTNQQFVSYQWFHNGMPLSNDSIIVPTSNGEYYVEVEFNGGCKQVSDTIIYDKLDLNQLVEQNVSIYPNPSKDKIHINNSFSENKEVLICDLTGRNVLKTMIQSNDDIVDINSLTNGAYFIEIGQFKSQFIKE